MIVAVLTLSFQLPRHSSDTYWWKVWWTEWIRCIGGTEVITQCPKGPVARRRVLQESSARSDSGIMLNDGTVVHRTLSQMRHSRVGVSRYSVFHVDYFEEGTTNLKQGLSAIVLRPQYLSSRRHGWSLTQGSLSRLGWSESDSRIGTAATTRDLPG